MTSFILYRILFRSGTHLFSATCSDGWCPQRCLSSSWRKVKPLRSSTRRTTLSRTCWCPLTSSKIHSNALRKKLKWADTSSSLSLSLIFILYQSANSLDLSSVALSVQVAGRSRNAAYRHGQRRDVCRHRNVRRSASRWFPSRQNHSTCREFRPRRPRV